MLDHTQGKLLNTYQKDYVIYDLETTGISSNYDEVIEISAIKVKDGVVVEEFSHLVNPGRRIPFQASQVNGITDDMVADAPFFDEVLEAFIAFIEELPLVGHNIQSFDNKFIYRDSLRFFGKVPNNDYLDTLKLAKGCLPQLSHHRLTDLASYYSIPTDGAHRALNDCRMNQKLFEYLAKEPLFGNCAAGYRKRSAQTATTKSTRQKTSVPETSVTGQKRLVSQREAQECIDILFGTHGAESNRRGNACPKCGNNLIKRSGRYGSFYGCSGFPSCRYTQNC